MLNVVAIPAFSDNYIWAISRDNDPRVAIVDPGQSAPVRNYLQTHGAELGAILVTHHHPDHVGGIAELTAHADIPVYGPAAEHARIPALTDLLRDGDNCRLDWLDLELAVIDVPGHTAGHIAFYGDGKLFAGDTLFSGGCGRLFEGTPQQMRNSLAKLRSLPAQTLLYCAHEYTYKNLQFALAVEPDNAAIVNHLDWLQSRRAANQPSLPTTLATEGAINPFLRWDQPAVAAAASHYAGQQLHDETAVFAAIRQWKDAF